MDDAPLPPYLEEAPALLQQVERLAERLKVPPWLVVFAGCLLLYLIGLATAATQGELELYLTYFVIPAGIGGVGFVLGAIVWAHRKYSFLIWDLRHGFRESYKRNLKRHWTRLTDPYRMIWMQLPFTAAAAGYVLLVRYVRMPWDSIPSFSDWIAYGSLPMFVYLTVCAGLAGFVASAGAYLIWEHIWFLRELPHTATNLRALLDREADLSQLARFSFYVSGTWFVGLVFVTIAFYHDVNAYTIGAYLAATLLGLAFFVLPQLFIHEHIVRAKAATVRLLRAKLPDEWRSSTDPHLTHESLALLNLIHQVDNLKEWPVEVNVIVLEFAAAVAPIFTVSLGSGLGIHV